jgi:sensor histidine kinase YesM
MKKDFFRKITRNKAVQHALFWMFSFWFLLQFFAYSNEINKTDWIYAGLFHLPLILAVYINLRLLIPKLLNGEKYLLYSAFAVLLILFTAWFLQFTFEVLTDYIFPEYYFISYYEMVDYVKFGVAYLGLTSLLKLSKGWFELYETKQLLEQLKSEKLQTELSALKGQINPHFLFNSLNSIYSLSIDNEPITPKFILKLSDVLRYMIYEANVEKVPLKKEIIYLENYVELQRLRVDEQANVKFEIKGKIKDQKIAPLLLIRN